MWHPAPCTGFPMNEMTVRSTTPAPFDTWAALDFWLRRWPWVACTTLLLALAGGWVARLIWHRSYTVSAQLIHYAPTAIDDAYHPRDISAPSLVLMLQSPSLYEKVGAMQQPAVPAKTLARRLQITLDRNNDVASVSAEGEDRDATVALVNQFSTEAIAYTQSLQKQEATEAADSVTKQLTAVEAELAASRAKVPAESAGAVAAAATEPEVDTTPAVVSDLPQRLQAARDQLDELTARYTDAHPLVREQRARVASLEESQRRAAAAAANSPTKARANSAAAAPQIFGRITPEEVAMGERLRTLENSRALLIARQRAIAPFRDAPPGYFSVLMPASATRVIEHGHRLEIGLCAILGAFAGLMLSAGQILFGEFLDNRIKTRADVRRVTGLPLLSTLGDLKKMPEADVKQWSFRAWTALQSHLSLTPNHGMVCGVTSAHTGDGRTTWINLLASAASSCGFRVLTITARPSPAIAAELARREKLPPPPEPTPASEADVAITANVLSTPGEITQKLSGVDSPPMVNIPLPGWVWNLDRRKQWQSALELWRTIENVVIFVELPPASVSETVLLAENIPNLLWLVDAGKSDAAETHNELETLRHARCNLVGAVLNRERAMPIRGRFSRWLGSSAFVALLGLGLALAHPPSAMAAETETAPAITAEASPTVAGGDTVASFSVADSKRRSGWQQKLTLGSGDVLSFHLFGQPELTRDEVPIGPDGRVSYLEAQNVLAAGLTVDEFRDKLNDELGKFRRSPQAFVTPVSFRSKKYYVMGTVELKGTFPLDRPMTIIEAVARSRGFETGMSEGAVVETTDFAHAFISRGGKHLPVDFEKLFMHGDLSQNIAIEPDDYLYFPAAGASSIYVLGEVRTPGSVPFNSNSNVLSAIAGRGGFTDRAWKERVMVVRGSLDHPQAFKVDIAGALTGSAANLALQPGDIVFINNRPWIKVEELLDRAASSFVEAAVVTWTGVHLGPKTTGNTSVSVP